LASEHSTLEVVTLLLKSGANVYAKNNSGKKVPYKNPEIQEVLKKVKAFFALIDNSSDQVKNMTKNISEILIKYPWFVHLRDENGNTPLMLAVNKGYEVIELLLEKGSDPYAKNTSEDTALKLLRNKEKLTSNNDLLAFAINKNYKNLVKALLPTPAPAAH
jgi:ankyrin repeat protein